MYMQLAQTCTEKTIELDREMEKNGEKVDGSRVYITDFNEKSVSRICGYLGELITNAFIQYCVAKGKRIKTLPLMIFDNSKYYEK